MYTFLVTIEPISSYRSFLPYDSIVEMPTGSFDKAVKKALSMAEKIYKRASVIRFEVPNVRRIYA